MATTKTTAPAERVTHPTLAAALAAFQAELPQIEKGRTGDAGKYKYQYADLADISPVVLPLLGKHGLSWSAQPTLMGDRFVLHYSLMHEGGEHSIEGVYPLPDASTPAQQLGSAITYARRYTLCSITGIAPGGDDDDAQSAPPAAPGRQSAPRASQQAATPAVRYASKDHAATILDATTVDELKAAYEAAEGEAGLPLPKEAGPSIHQLVERWGLDKPAGPISFGQLVSAVKTAIESAPPVDEPTTEWETAPIPDGGEPV